MSEKTDLENWGVHLGLIIKDIAVLLKSWLENKANDKLFIHKLTLLVEGLDELNREFHNKLI